MNRQFSFMICIAVGTCNLLASAALAQGNRPRDEDAPDVRQLDMQAQQLQQEFLQNLVDLATGYEEAGELEKAKETFRTVLTLDPENEQVQAKIEELDNRVFEENQTTVDVDVAEGWVNTGILVTKDRPVRIEAQGTYRFIVNEELGPMGFPTGDPSTQIIDGVPAGTLIGVVFPTSRPQGQNREEQQPQPFFIGASREYTPTEDGILYLRVNLPAGHRCVGKLEAAFSGNIAPAQ
jgi:hypothetical protein